MQKIKTEILRICDVFNLGKYISSKTIKSHLNGFILTEFETDKGIYKHYFNTEKL